MTRLDFDKTDDKNLAVQLVEARLGACGANRIDQSDDDAWLAFGAGSHPIPVRVLVADVEGWLVSLDDACPITDASGEIGFWILVDPVTASTFVIPEWWIRNDIDEMQAAYAVRATVGAPDAPDASVDDRAPSPVIDRERVERWRDRWDLIEKLLK